MHELGKISDEEYEQAKAEPLVFTWDADFVPSANVASRADSCLLYTSASKKIESNSLYEIKEDTAKDAAVAAAAQKIIDRIDKERCV